MCACIRQYGKYSSAPGWRYRAVRPSLLWTVHPFVCGGTGAVVSAPSHVTWVCYVRCVCSVCVVPPPIKVPPPVNLQRVGCRCRPTHPPTQPCPAHPPPVHTHSHRCSVCGSACVAAGEEGGRFGHTLSGYLGAFATCTRSVLPAASVSLWVCLGVALVSGP